MKLYLNTTANLGDFLNAMPVMSGLVKSTNEKLHLIVKSDLQKFKGFKDFLMYQGIFEEVEFDSDVFVMGVKQLSSWTREDKNDPNRPIETCRYENFLKDTYGLQFDVDDAFEIKFPNLDIPVNPDVNYVGDRWSVGNVDSRRASHTLSYLKDCEFIDYNNDLLTNAYIIKTSNKPFITSISGVSVLADLLNKESYAVWKAEDWNPEFRVGDNITWDNGKDINQVFAKHYYGNRKMKLVHDKDLKDLL